MKKHSLYFISGLSLLLLSGCASNKFNEYWETTTVTTTKIQDLSHNKPTSVERIVKEVEEDRTVETFKVETPEVQKEVTIESSLSEGEEIVNPNGYSD